MSTLLERYRWYALTGAVNVLLGLWLGWYFWHSKPLPIEAAAPAIVLPKSNALVVERKPSEPVPEQVKAAVKELGKGAKLERAVKLTVQPKGETDCKKVDLELGIVRMPDETQRVIARSDDGEIVGGVDIPIAAQPLPRNLKWSAGGAYDVAERRYGIYIDRDFGPFRIGADIMRRTEETGLTAIVRVGIRF